jgi:hypothetical protein
LVNSARRVLDMVARKVGPAAVVHKTPAAVLPTTTVPQHGRALMMKGK